METMRQLKKQNKRVQNTKIAKEFMTKVAMLGIYIFVQCRLYIRKVNSVASLIKMKVNLAMYFNHAPP